MPQTIPLTGLLRIDYIQIIKRHSIHDGENMVLRRLAIEVCDLELGQIPTEGDSLTGLYA
jgi:hypothetical protein